MSVPERHPELDKFLHWEEQEWIEVVADTTTDDTAFFMPLELLKSHFAANRSRVLCQILCELFNALYPPVDAELVLREHTAIFCVLLRLGQGRMIEHFLRYEELSDRRLPFDAAHPPAEFPRLKEDPTFLQRFCEVQWMYCVPVLDGHMLHKHFGRQRLLPIVEKHECGLEGKAVRYLLRLYGPHNRLVPVSKTAGTTIRTPDTFELEVYQPQGGEEQYLETVNGFRSVKHAESIRRFCGSYIHGDEFNILLEHADKGSLEDYFRTESPPSSGTAILSFWEALFQLIKGLKAIHSVRQGHYGVSPSSVLVFNTGMDSPSHRQFKFADFGRQTSNDRRIPATKRSLDVEDPLSYCAPECHLASEYEARGDADPSKMTWAADIWSLGCIYSEAAIWIADGYKGLLAYRQERMAEVARLCNGDSNCFHDGERVLELVLSHHRDIEDRLRRSDHITRHVLDAMVDEMLWEEDRPNAKALWRKADIILTKTRQSLSPVSKEQASRPGSNQTRGFSQTPYPRFPPPSQPLPPIPQILQPRLRSVTEKQISPNVERWRSEVPGSQNIAHQKGSDAELTMPLISRRRLSVADSSTDLDREGIGSSVGLQDGSTVTSSPTPFISPHTSSFYENRRPSLEDRPRIISNQANHGHRRSSLSVTQLPAYNTAKDTSAETMVWPRQGQRAITPTEKSPGWQSGGQPSPAAVSNDSKSMGLMGAIGRVTSRASSRYSSSNHSTSHSINSVLPPFSVPSELHIPSKSSRRVPGFSLFPTESRSDRSARPAGNHPPERRTINEDRVPRTIPSIPSIPTKILLESDPADISMEHLSVEACLEWKRAHKKIKKQSKVPPLPGAHLLESLNGRDHVFIIDDSASMFPVWPEVKRVFEAVSYIVKPMSPDGTELFFTISYDTWRRKDTSELCTYLESKKTAGETNMSYRLNLQLQTFRAKLIAARMNRKTAKKGKAVVARPMNIYILTNGEWVKGTGPQDTIKEMADFMVQENISDGQVIIGFVSFAQTEEAAKRISDLGKRDYGVNILDSSSYNSNVLKILRGALDKPRRPNTRSVESKNDIDRSTIAGSITRAERSGSNPPTGREGSLRKSSVSELA